MDNKKKENKKIETKNKKIKKDKNEISKIEERKFHNYLWYIIIFSIICFLIEVLLYFIPIGKNIGLTLSTLCPIYGISALLIFIYLSKYKGHVAKLFIYGAVLGTLIQYLVSFLLEGTFGVTFWDYSTIKFNLNGRICLYCSLFWGIVTVISINLLQKPIDGLISKMKGKASKVIDIILTILLSLSIIFTTWGIATYSIRTKETLNGKNYISNNNFIEKFQNTVFSNSIMEKVFPNLRIVDNTGKFNLVKNINNQ